MIAEYKPKREYISYEQVENRGDAYGYIRLEKDEENESGLKTIIKYTNHGLGAKYKIYVEDLSRDIENVNNKKYRLWYGQKSLYAFEKMNITKIPVFVLPDVSFCKWNDIAKEFQIADYISLNPYEKGQLINKIGKEHGITEANLYTKTMLSAHSLIAYSQAYRNSEKYPILKELYQSNALSTNSMNSLAKYFKHLTMEEQNIFCNYVKNTGKLGANYLMKQFRNGRSFQSIMTDAELPKVKNERKVKRVPRVFGFEKISQKSSPALQTYEDMAREYTDFFGLDKIESTNIAHEIADNYGNLPDYKKLYRALALLRILCGKTYPNFVDIARNKSNDISNNIFKLIYDCYCRMRKNYSEAFTRGGVNYRFDSTGLINILCDKANKDNQKFYNKKLEKEDIKKIVSSNFWESEDDTELYIDQMLSDPYRMNCLNYGELYYSRLYNTVKNLIFDVIFSHDRETLKI